MSKKQQFDPNRFVLAVNPEEVRRLLDFLRQAYESYIKVYAENGYPVQYVDAFMAVHNFHRLVIDDLIRRTGHKALAQAAVDTFKIGMLHRDQAVSVSVKLGDDDEDDHGGERS